MECPQWARQKLVALCSETPRPTPVLAGGLFVFLSTPPYVALRASLANGTNYACGLSVEFP
jgi:hypothetical protein